MERLLVLLRLSLLQVKRGGGGMIFTLIVIAEINGAASVATHIFPTGEVCKEIARDLLTHSEVRAAKCFAMEPNYAR